MRRDGEGLGEFPFAHDQSQRSLSRSPVHLLGLRTDTVAGMRLGLAFPPILQSYSSPQGFEVLPALGFSWTFLTVLQGVSWIGVSLDLIQGGASHAHVSQLLGLMGADTP